MGLSLRDQLLQAGFQEKKPEPKPQRAQGGKPPPNKPGKGHQRPSDRPSPPAPPKPPGENLSLAHAYQLRAETEKREREEAQRRAEEAARLKREQRQKLQQLASGKALNHADAEHARNFMYGKKIRKVNVTADQLLGINQGALGVVQVDGRFLILDAEVVRQAIALAPQHVAVFVPENIGVSDSKDDDYADPRYQVPDDLVW